MITLWIVTCAFFILTDAVLLNVKCSYYFNVWEVISPYTCVVQNSINVVLSEGLIINSATGSHDSRMNNNDVTSFQASDKKFQFFPKELDKIFNNLEGIVISNAQIKEVSQSELKPFTKLVHLSLHVNEIVVIAEDLFKFNPNLKMISLRDNKIKQIHSKVFDNLPHLVTLRLSKNQCIDKDSKSSPTAVQDTIRQVKLQCTIVEQVNIGMEIRALDKAINDFKLKDYEANNTEFKDNFAKTEAQIKDLGLPKTHELSKMLDEVYVVKVPFVVTLFKEIYNANQKSIQNLSQQVTKIQEDVKNFKFNVTLGILKILEKLDEKSEKPDKEIIEKIQELQLTQNQEISDISDKIKTLENDLDGF
ncbi:hypothetical protein ACKWTF_015158 [Chironomus riparius]